MQAGRFHKNVLAELNNLLDGVLRTGLGWAHSLDGKHGMQCLRCQHEAPSDAQFCPECGAKLAVVCGQCGASNAPGHKFCKACGQALARASIKTDARFASPDAYTPRTSPRRS